MDRPLLIIYIKKIGERLKKKAKDYLALLGPDPFVT